MNQKLVIITLVGVIAGMVLSVPTFFIGEVVGGGLFMGLLALVIGYFATRDKKSSEKSDI
jgi:hypothetical protein